MKSYIKFLLFVLLFIGFVFPSCSDDDYECNCPELIGEFFDIETVDLKNFSLRENGTKQPIEDINTAIDWDQYVMRGEFGVSFFGYNESTPGFNFSLMPAAYGCSCIGNGSVSYTHLTLPTILLV